MIRCLIRGADEKQATEIKTKGVVGQTGNIIPMAPNPRNKNPKAVKKIVFKCKSPHYTLLGHITNKLPLIRLFKTFN